VTVIDGQGGGIGGLIIKRLREEFGDKIDILAKIFNLEIEEA